MPETPTTQHSRTQTLWQTCLVSAYHTALACTIVGCTTLYGPAILTNQIAYPAFSYVTVILVITDATLGDTVRGCWLALYATVISIGPAILSLWLIGPGRLTSGTTALAVTLAAFVVVLPEGTHLIAKRIALGQIVITYVIGFINGPHTEAVMHPVHVAASTGVGVMACVLALVFPYPRLACLEVKQNCKLLADNDSERLKLLVKAFCAEDNILAQESVSQAKYLTVTGTKLLQSIKRYQESMKWEKLPFNFLRSYYINPSQKLQELEIPLRGMEMALTATTTSFPARMLDTQIKDSLLRLEKHISLTLNRVRNGLASDSITVPESNTDEIMNCLDAIQITPTTNEDLSSLFFLFCIKLLQGKSLAKPAEVNLATKGENSSIESKENGFFKSILANKLSIKRFMPAFKCSLSLGLAVLFGLKYSKENGFWSGLPVAISLASTREATFKVANVKAQGTVLGTVYGVIGCFVLERFLPIRFLSLLPWFIFTSFLRRSRMYGQAGGISAVIGAVLILGRKNFGPPSEFAIARIVETFIGLSCSIMVELVLQPTRASALSKLQLSNCLRTLQNCMGSISLGANKAELFESQNRLKVEVNELMRFIGEAEVEPNFWFLPFHSACYGKLLDSLSKMVDLLLFSAHAVGFLQQESHNSWKQNLNKLENDLKLFKDMVVSLIKCFEEITMIKSLTALDKELEKNNVSCDLELGKSTSPNFFKVSGSDEAEKISTSYLQHSREAVEKICMNECNEKEVKCQMVLSLGALGYCMSDLVRETRKVENEISELVQSENPSSHVNLHEISCKIRALYCCTGS
ncbi:uncharacterized protein LOC120010750 [Tripterygium wilfordii]|uniref:uncharacterized protein LOC120010750 n=1 Tax=Tripterygium wilfordii TaxID=458696 RepID=UPI0018F802D5|nr:uncharacterized protein LOC120010750 [Tripterygium wilfordii]